MKLLFLISVLMAESLMVGCSHAPPRTKWTDPTMRVMVDPDSVDSHNYVRIEQALVASGKWIVVDRGDGYKAMKKEQEAEHKDEPERFMDREKYAHWGKLYGVGGVVVGHTQCTQKGSFWGKLYSLCQQNLAIVNARTGEIIAVADSQSETENNEYELAPSWENVVALMNDAYPSHYEPNKDTAIIADYKELSAEEAKRAKEQLASEGK